MTDLVRQLRQRLVFQLQRFPSITRLVVAYSGGLDSTALLHAVVAVQRQSRPHASQSTFPRIEAVHVNHDLSTVSNQWVDHCRVQCEALDVPLHCRAVRVDNEAGDSGAGVSGPGKIPEASARRARYRAFAELLDEQSALLLAHHQDDQAETVLMRLMRGAGPAGLSGMPEERRLGRGWLWRPLLALSRAQLEQYAMALGVSWVDDESNADPRMDRNHVRHRVVPEVAARWPSWRERCLLSAQLCAESARLNASLARIDTDSCRSGRVPFVRSDNQLDCRSLSILPTDRQRNVLRFWLQCRTGVAGNRATLSRILEEIIPARRDACPEMPLTGYRLHRHQGVLCLVPKLDTVLPDWRMDWTPERDGERLCLPGNGELVARLYGGGGVPEGVPLRLRYRVSGERCQLPGRPRRALARVLREHAIPVWWRDRLPLVTVNGEVAWIPGVGVCQPASRPGGSGWLFDWVAPGCEPGDGSGNRENSFVEDEPFW